MASFKLGGGATSFAFPKIRFIESESVRKEDEKLLPRRDLRICSSEVLLISLSIFFAAVGLEIDVVI